MPIRPGVVLSPGEWAVLGVLAEGQTHGFAIAQRMSQKGDLGQVWTLPRPVVYQALHKLLQLELIGERGVERTPRGPARTIVDVTRKGRRAIEQWRNEPVEHVRDVRSLLLLKLALLDRADLDPAPLIHAQLQQLEPRIEALGQRRDASEGFERTLATWRLESSLAAVRFLGALRDDEVPRRGTTR